MSHKTITSVARPEKGTRVFSQQIESLLVLLLASQDKTTMEKDSVSNATKNQNTTPTGIPQNGKILPFSPMTPLVAISSQPIHKTPMIRENVSGKMDQPSEPDLVHLHGITPNKPVKHQIKPELMLTSRQIPHLLKNGFQKEFGTLLIPFAQLSL
jgi:hypothetical protein